MDRLFVSNKMWVNLSEYCSKDMIECVLKNFEDSYATHFGDDVDENVWEVTDFINSKSDFPITTKMEVILSFLKSDGKVVYCGKDYFAVCGYDRSFNGETHLLYDIKMNGIITVEQMIAIYNPWIESSLVIPQFYLTENYECRVEYKRVQ